MKGLFLPIKGKSGLAGNDQLLNSIYLERGRDREKSGGGEYFSETGPLTLWGSSEGLG